MSWTRSILLFIIINVAAIGLMVLPYYLALDEPVITATAEIVLT